MPNKINVFRPDGSLTSVTPAQYERLKKLGYKAETTEEAVDRATDVANEEHYTSLGQKALTVGEGILSGATVGLIDPLLDDNATRQRAAYNPGTRIGAEIIGGVGTAIASGGAGGAASVARVLPAGLAARAGAGVARAVGGGARGIVAGAALEGGIAGAGQSITRATLDSEPITSEAILAGAGWGSVYGAGLGLGISGASKIAGKYVKAREAAKAKEFVNPVKDDDYTRLAGRINETTQVGKVVNEKASSAAGRVKAYSDEIAKIEKDLSGAESSFSKLGKESSSEFESTFAKQSKHRERLVKELDQEVKSRFSDLAYKEFKTDPDKFFANNKLAGVELPGRKRLLDLEEEIFNTRDKYLSKIAGEEENLFKQRDISKQQLELYNGELKKGQDAVEKYSRYSEAIKNLENFPRSASEFISMKPSRAEKLLGSLDAIVYQSADELDPLKESLKAAIEDVVTKSGITVSSGTPVDALRKVYTIGNQSAAEHTLEEIQRAIKHGGDHKVGGFLQRVAKQASARGASGAARSAGAGAFTSSAAYQGASAVASYLTGGMAGVVAELSGIRSAVMGRLSKAVSALNPSKNKFVKHLIPRVEPLTVKLDGTIDKDNKKYTRQELAKKRIEEIAAAAPTIKETLYSAVNPIAGEHTEFAAAFHQSALDRFNYVFDNMPKDPGLAFNQLNSLWKPNPVQVEQFSRLMQVFQDPVEVIEEWTGDIATIDPIRANAMKEMWPALFQEVRTGVLMRLSELPQLSYSDQARLSNLLDLELHSSFKSTSIAARQAQFMEVPEESAMQSKSPNPAGRSGGRPASPEPPTAGQSLIT